MVMTKKLNKKKVKKGMALPDESEEHSSWSAWVSWCDAL